MLIASVFFFVRLKPFAFYYLLFFLLQRCRVAEGGGGGLRRQLYNNTIGGTVPASLSALIQLSYLCAAPPALACFAPARARGGCAQQPVRAVYGGGAGRRAAMRTRACGDDAVAITTVTMNDCIFIRIYDLLS